MIITNETIRAFKLWLIHRERAQNTVKKYMREIELLREWLRGRELTKETVIEYKEELKSKYNSSRSVNTAISSLNSFFEYLDMYDLHLKTIKNQKQVFAETRRILGKSDYDKLIDFAKKLKKKRLWLIMQVLGGCGIRINELKCITVESLECEQVAIQNKGKTRNIAMPDVLRRRLREYARERGIESGAVFITKHHNPLDCSNIRKELKKLAALAKVMKSKVYPHSFRKLFARTYHKKYNDLSKLASLLGHSNINTTHLYTMDTFDTVVKQVNRLGLVI